MVTQPVVLFYGDPSTYARNVYQTLHPVVRGYEGRGGGGDMCVCSLIGEVHELNMECVLHGMYMIFLYSLL